MAGHRQLPPPPPPPPHTPKHTHHSRTEAAPLSHKFLRPLKTPATNLRPSRASQASASPSNHPSHTTPFASKWRTLVAPPPQIQAATDQAIFLNSHHSPNLKERSDGGALPPPSSTRFLFGSSASAGPDPESTQNRPFQHTQPTLSRRPRKAAERIESITTTNSDHSTDDDPLLGLFDDDEQSGPKSGHLHLHPTSPPSTKHAKAEKGKEQDPIKDLGPINQHFSPVSPAPPSPHLPPTSAHSHSLFSRKRGMTAAEIATDSGIRNYQDSPKRPYLPTFRSVTHTPVTATARSALRPDRSRFVHAALPESPLPKHTNLLLKAVVDPTAAAAAAAATAAAAAPPPPPPHHHTAAHLASSAFHTRPLNHHDNSHNQTAAHLDPVTVDDAYSPRRRKKKAANQLDNRFVPAGVAEQLGGWILQEWERRTWADGNSVGRA